MKVTSMKEKMWGAQLDKVMNIAYRAFWTCKGIFGNA